MTLVGIEQHAVDRRRAVPFVRLDDPGGSLHVATLLIRGRTNEPFELEPVAALGVTVTADRYRCPPRQLCQCQNGLTRIRVAHFASVAPDERLPNLRIFQIALCRPGHQFNKKYRCAIGSTSAGAG
jgi:hypothetical protein